MARFRYHTPLDNAQTAVFESANCVKLHLRDKRARSFVRCVCHRRPFYEAGNEKRCFTEI